MIAIKKIATPEDSQCKIEEVAISMTEATSKIYKPILL